MAEGSDCESHLVCVRCLEDNPRNLELTRFKCIAREAHKGARNIQVWLWKKEELLEIYPRAETRPPVRATPHFLRFPGRFKLCFGLGTDRCRGERQCNHAHSVQEMEHWNGIKFQSRSQLPTGQRNTERSNSQQSRRYNRQSDGPTERKWEQNPRKLPVPTKYGYEPRVRRESKVFSKEEMSLLSHALVQSNYKEKLKLLLDLEERAHRQELHDRCDGDYTLHFENDRPNFRNSGPWNRHTGFAYINGLNGDQIGYATQASRRVTITTSNTPTATTFSADILPRNYNDTQERLYLGFRDDHFRAVNNQQDLSVTVQFELKYQYFDRLRDSVRRVPDSVLSRIVPCEATTKESTPCDLEKYMGDLNLHLCSDDQLEALKATTSCTAGEPPLIITGPFGSGKTRVLALAAHISLKSFQKPVRLLVCAHQHVSADAFLSCFNDLTPVRVDDVHIVRVITENTSPHPDLQEFTATVDKLDHLFKSGMLDKKGKVMIVTTCSTANTLLFKKVFPPGYFSHIYIDEGAQMREPEAVAPLGFATRDTIVVIAGDQHQVGPAMLVLGKEPLEHGLSVSFVERLHKLYTEEVPDLHAKNHRALTTNFRCHPGIMKLSGKLFYHAPLTSKIEPHKKAPFPFHFVCSDVEDKLRPTEMGTFYIQEVEIVVRQMERFSVPGKVFPLDGNKPDTSQFAVASPCRSQLTMINRELQKYKKLNEVQRVPTYVIQGNEYFALFLSTTEPTHEDGSTRNPTKSICDPFVFNTVISRARSVVVSIGNPFTLLRKETHMCKKYGDKAKCWSNYLRLCVNNGTIVADPSLRLSDEEWSWKLKSLQGLVDKMLSVTANLSLPSIRHEEASDSVPTGQHEILASTDLKQPPANISEENIFTRDYKVVGRLGKGGYGVVYRVKKKFDDGNYAVKIIKLLPKSKHDIKREVKALAKLNHSRIVTYHTSWTETLPKEWRHHDLWADLKDSETYTQTVAHDLHSQEDKTIAPATVSSDEKSAPSTDDSFIAFEHNDSSQNMSTESEAESEPKRKHSQATPEKDQTTTCLFIQTELCKGDTLRDWLTDHTDKRPRGKVLQFMKQILEAVQYIHHKKLIHRDLKPSNILFALDQLDDSESLKVGDFGLVTHWEQSKMTDKLTAATRSKSNSSRKGGKFGAHTSNAGTELYRSPEQRAKKTYNSKVDIFAMGLIFFELNYPMITGHQMNNVFSDLREKGGAGFPESFKKSLPHEAKLIGAMLNPDPEKRPTAQAIIEGYDLKKIEEDIEKSGEEFVPFDE